VGKTQTYVKHGDTTIHRTIVLSGNGLSDHRANGLTETNPNPNHKSVSPL